MFLTINDVLLFEQYDCSIRDKVGDAYFARCEAFKCTAQRLI